MTDHFSLRSVMNGRRGSHAISNCAKDANFRAEHISALCNHHSERAGPKIPRISYSPGRHICGA